MNNEFQNLPAEKQKQVLEAASDMEKPCSPAEVREQLLRKGNYEKGEYAFIAEVCEEYMLREVEHISSPEALLVDCMVRHDCTARDAIRLLLGDENNTYSKNELYAAHLALKERFG